MSTEVTVQNNPTASRYEAIVDGEVAGFAEYVVKDGVIAFTHTVVEPAFEGRGIGSALVRNSLDEVRADGELKVRPLCPFYKKYIQTHPEYADLL